MIYFIVYLNGKLQYGLWRYHISPDHLVQGNSYWQCSLLSRNQMHVPVHVFAGLQDCIQSSATEHTKKDNKTFLLKIFITDLF